MNIKQRLALFVVIAVVFIILSAGTGWFFFDYRIGGINHTKDSVSAISNKIISGRVLEKRYLQFLKPELKKEFEEYCSEIDRDLKIMGVSLGEEAGQKLEQVVNTFRNYQDLFRQLCESIESAKSLKTASAKPLQNCKDLVRKMQGSISDRQTELQMEGEDLDSNHVGLIILLNEISTILFRLESLQEQYLTSGNEDFLKESDGIIAKDGMETVEGICQFASLIKTELLLSNSKQILTDFTSLAPLTASLKDGYNRQQGVLRQLDEEGNRVIEAIEAIRVFADTLIDEEKTSAYSYLSVVLIASLVAFILTSILIAVRITRPINEVTSVVKEIARGNLKVSITHESNDEIGVMTAAFKDMVAEQQKKVVIARSISDGDFTRKIDLSSQEDSLGQAFNNMSGSLAEVLSRISNCASEVADIANRVLKSSDGLSESSVKSASSLEELGGSLTEIGNQVSSNAENANTASKLAATAMSSANNGNEKMQEMTKAMAQIKESSEKIKSILKVIEDIAFQTNLLALNAAVEAARAGRHGKGFAVVADEVRNLAARSGKAVRETADLIESSSNVVEEGAEISRKTAGALAEIVGIITETSGLVHKISEASNEQAMRVAEINSGIEQLDRFTKTNTIEAEKSHNDAQELAQRAEELRKLLSRFKLGSDQRKS